MRRALDSVPDRELAEVGEELASWGKVKNVSHLVKFAMQKRQVKAPSVGRKWMSARLTTAAAEKMR